MNPWNIVSWRFIFIVIEIGKELIEINIFIIIFINIITLSMENIIESINFSSNLKDKLIEENV